MEERFQIYEALFQTEGWELFVKEFIDPPVEDVPAAAFENAKSIEEIVAARIIRDKLQIIQNLPTVIAEQRTEWEEEEELRAREDEWRPE